MKKQRQYEAPVLIDATELMASSRPERIGVCITGGSKVELQ